VSGQVGTRPEHGEELMPQGIHVANVPIDAAIGWTQEDEPRPSTGGNDRRRQHGRPGHIAETYLHLQRQHRSTWAFEVVLRPWVENGDRRGTGQSSKREEDEPCPIRSGIKRSCNLCYVNCGLEVATEGARSPVCGRSANSAPRGTWSEAATFAVVRRPRRSPDDTARRRLDGTHEPISWDTASSRSPPA
jgi:hypothetical protein